MLAALRYSGGGVCGGRRNGPELSNGRGTLHISQCLAKRVCKEWHGYPSSGTSGNGGVPAFTLSDDIWTSDTRWPTSGLEFREETDISVLLVTNDDGPSVCIKCSDFVDMESLWEAALNVVAVTSDGWVHLELTDSSSSASKSSVLSKRKKPTYLGMKSSSYHPKPREYCRQSHCCCWLA